MRIFSAFLAMTCLALAFVVRATSTALAATFDFVINLVPVDARAVFSLDNGHPRSPLASMRAGLA